VPSKVPFASVHLAGDRNIPMRYFCNYSPLCGVVTRA